MSNAKHTPGPWTVYSPASTGRWGWCIGTQSQILARICTGRGGIQGRSSALKEANARLMAAAPDLLAACEAMLRAIGHYSAEHRFAYGTEVGIANRAVAKATGEVR